jgi:hypothetical protein
MFHHTAARIPRANLIAARRAICRKIYLSNHLAPLDNGHARKAQASARFQLCKTRDG